VTSPADEHHEHRRTSFGEVAAAYAGLRPDWPEATAAWLVGADLRPVRDGWGAGLDVLDLGAGTGKLTATLVAAGHRVTAVDASEQMLVEQARAVPSARSLLGTAEAIPVGDASQDAVTVAQAWHWFDEAAAQAECARVLRPGGVLGIGWHIRHEIVPWVAELAEAVGRSGDSTSSRRGEGLVLGPPFGPVEHRVFDYALTTTPEGLRDLADTWSYVYLAPDRQARLDVVLEIGRRAAAPGGRLVVPHVTQCYRAVRG
jgi:SAM-dependent methyltransferase